MRRAGLKLSLKKPAKGELDQELLWGVLFIPLLAALFFLVVRFGADRGIYCAFHRTTGIPCPACGSFRAAQLLLQGHWLQALALQPLVTTLTAASVVYILYAWLTVLFRLPRVRAEHLSRTGWRVVVGTAFALVLANWIYVILQPAV